jgi:hypothetical protein
MILIFGFPLQASSVPRSDCKIALTDTSISNKAMTYSLYINKVLKQVHPNTSISNKTTVTYSSYIYKVLK